LKIISLEVTNFKGTKKAKYQFGDRVVILGDNYTGKTSIAEAIVFGLYGINLDGSSRTDALINQDSKKAEVTVHVEVNGESYEITREATRQKKVSLNGVQASQTEIEKIIGPVDKFMIAFWPTHVLGMKDAEAREFFMSLVKKVEQSEVLDQLEQVYSELIKDLDLRDPEERKKRLRADIDELKRDIDFLEGAIATHQRTLEADIPEEIDTKEYEKQLKEIEQLLFNAKSKQPTLHDTSELEQKINELQYRMINDIPEPPVLPDTRSVEQRIISLRTQYAVLQKQAEQLKAPFNIGDQCPTCKQTIGEETYDSFQVEISDQKARLQHEMNLISEEGKTLKSYLDEVMKNYEAELAVYEVNKEDFISTLQEELQATQNHLQYLRNVNKEILENWHQRESNNTAELKAQRDRIASLLNDANWANQERKSLLERIDKAKVEIATLQQRVKQNEVAIHENKQKIEAINQYIAKYAEMQAKQIEQHFNKVTIQLFDITKTTGEVKPVFKLLYDNKPIGILSMSERIRLGLEVAGMIKKVTGVLYPTFIDNAESITHFDKIPGQLFTATVVQGKELEVA
jgi:DNA repair exonuclease SbcCD ATPase subunit